MITAHFVCRLGALLPLVAATIAAQPNATSWNTVQALAAGTPVRITADSRTVRGNVARISDGSLAVTSGRGSVTFDRQQVSVVSVMRPSHRKRNALIGLAAGTGVGLGVGVAARSKPGQLQVVPNGAIIAGFTVAVAFVGVIVGVVIPTGGWYEIYKK